MLRNESQTTAKAQATSQPTSSATIGSKTNIKSKERNKTLYFLTWRWHFYAGLFVIPFMLMLSITGLVMLFDDEIELAFHHDAIEIVALGDPIKVSQQLAAVQNQYPQGSVTQFVPSKVPDLANRFSVSLEDGTSVFATVNQYTGEVVGEVPRSDSLYQLANDIHGTLLIGDWGDYLIEVAISLSILLLVSGIYLWLPRDNASRAGFLKLRVSSGPRVLMRDLHANIGGTLSLILLLFILSGLAWTGFWGGKLVQAWSTFPAQMWDDIPLSDKTHASLNHGSEEELPWNLEQTPLPLSQDKPAEHVHHVEEASEPHDHSKMGDDHSMHVMSVSSFAIDDVIEKARSLGFTHYKVNFPRSEAGVYTVTANTMGGDIINPTQDHTTHLDQYSGRILGEVTWQDYNFIAKTLAVGISLHQGDISIINKLLNALFCLAFIVVSVTGGVMWWMRRPSGQSKLGTPPKFGDAGLWKAGLVTVVIISILFPLAGATIVIAMLLDWLLFSRVERFKTALS
ncbi:putative iron-regulated membrane protein [Vibrio crassostreae]|uniref:PepSY-associated TM helix domain-containing protein n=1 Tax=Vibrio crassostreae TaxID=246167 RepID=UPI001B301DB9|nr:PepSY domain-containing protein [Vibrio crassostreae]CAK1692591.1 putative iron-regulated membrane protein [Vibrio crassostreae]CAK1708624.1 putative iron-regulated membrane protein [Vibrio crassostreae]CAK1709827.1 putative iron-regulated membrane protein [Vibrio crassostreae]CAK1710661.1 putative iron-regulated membrane protein [Vibrio crassostreae]CAK1712802.1 putative iron-regulated membrane protein [Vibrio crassostreae]